MANSKYGNCVLKAVCVIEHKPEPPPCVMHGFAVVNRQKYSVDCSMLTHAGAVVTVPS